jgi:transposase
MIMKHSGIDVSKNRLDIAIEGMKAVVSESNDSAGHQRLIDRFASEGVTRIGLEASGNYEAAAVVALRRAGFTVLVLDPRQIHGFRKFRNGKAKTDRPRPTGSMPSSFWLPSASWLPTVRHRTRACRRLRRI